MLKNIKSFFILFTFLIFSASQVFASQWITSPKLFWFNNGLRFSGICVSDSGTVNKKAFISYEYSSSDWLRLDYGTGGLMTIYCSNAGTSNNTPIEGIKNYVWGTSTCALSDSENRLNGVSQLDFLNLGNFSRGLLTTDEPFVIHLVPDDYAITCTSSLDVTNYYNNVALVFDDSLPLLQPTYPPENVTTYISTSSYSFYDYGKYSMTGREVKWTGIYVDYSTTSDFSDVTSNSYPLTLYSTSSNYITEITLPAGTYYRRYRFQGYDKSFFPTEYDPMCLLVQVRQKYRL